MGLSDDQRALLRLLAQREEGYEDIAALMGIGVDEVRARVKDALAALDDERRSAGPVAAAEEGTPAAGPAAAGDPPPPAVAKASSGAVPPATPPAEEKPATAPASPSSEVRAAPARPSRQPEPAQRSLAPKGRRRLIELVGGVVVVLLIVLFATGAVDIGGGDSDSDSGTTTTASPGQNGAAETNSKELTQAILTPVDGGDAKGLALFGRSKGAVLLLVQAEGLEPSTKGRSYAISLSRSPTERIPIAVTRVGGTGSIEAQYPVPAEALGLLATGFDEMEISLVSNAALKTALTKAGKEQKAPDYAGDDVLRGKVTGPIVSLRAK